MKYFPTLEDTVTLMLSDDYENRLLAEYWQTKIRYERLRYALMSTEQEDEVKPNSHLDNLLQLWSDQIEAMKDYLDVLEERLGLITAGIVLFMAALLTMPGGRKRQKYQEWNYRDAYADELEARRRAKASWDSIRRANEK